MTEEKGAVEPEEGSERLSNPPNDHPPEGSFVLIIYLGANLPIWTEEGELCTEVLNREMEVVEDEVGADPDGNVEGSDYDEKISCLPENSRDACALQKANLCHLNVKIVSGNNGKCG